MINVSHVNSSGSVCPLVILKPLSPNTYDSDNI
uniref:Uncharacterized protein n=1 Tax=Rhizophora mucronata TaxID=61149 RepID=A0A2P2R4H7_RHIMU